jgi:hypothetical protein
MGDALAPVTGRNVKMLKQIGALPADPGPDGFLTQPR